MSRRAAKKDLNHNAIAAAVRAVGGWAFDCSDKGEGFPDMVVVLPDGRAAWVTEIKTESGRFTEPELRFQVQLIVPSYRVFVTPEQAIKALMEAK